MKTCQNCGNLITESARFCLKCGALLQDDSLYEPLETLHHHPLTVAGPQTETAAQTADINSKNGPFNKKILLLCVAGLLTIILTCVLIGASAASGGITGSWKLTMDIEDFADYMDMDASLYQMVGMDNFDVQLNLADDNTLTLGLYAGGDSVSVDSVTVGTYEVLSDDTIHIALGERTTKYSIFGEEETETDDFDDEDDFTYSLDGNKLTLIVEDMPLQFKRS